MTREDRENQILQEVITKREASVSDLAKKFNVTMETIRKDIASLQEKNILSKDYGKVKLADPFLEGSFLEKESRDLSAKVKIAKTAIDFIPQDAVIFLDTSTTVLQLARLLSLRSDLTIVTNSLRISEVLSNNTNNVLMTGGMYRDKSKSFVGGWALRNIKSVNFDISFLGSDGFSNDGATIGSYHELEIKKEVIKRSKKTALLISTSKLGKTGNYTFTNFNDIDMIIMDRKLTESERKHFPGELLFINKE